MTLTQKYNFFSISLILGLLLAFANLPFSIYGGDGYYLWYPIIGEYLRGDRFYQNSFVIFDGQNLLSIYGDLPFWSLMRYFGLPIREVLNYTHFLFVSILFLISIRIVNGMKGNKSFSDIFLVFLYCSLGPIITNRVMEGHFNLLFGLFPILISIALIFDKSKISIFIYIFAFWCTLSIQSYQIIAYHIFYIPILHYFISKFERDKKKYFATLIFIFMISFSLSFINFQEMLLQAVSHNSPRTLDQNIVYSYLVSIKKDLWHFILSRSDSDILKVEPGFFHELNYPVGAFAFMMFVFMKKDRFPLLIFSISIILFLFCMNIPGANYLSELPLIKSFRVPQRVFMVISFLIPLWHLGMVNYKYNLKQIASSFLIILIAQFIDYFDIISIFVIVIMLALPKWRNSKFTILIALSGLLSGTLPKISIQSTLEDHYSQMYKLLLPLKKEFSSYELDQIRFHFNTSQPVLANYVAQSIGISTSEGYGHPPKHLYNKLRKLTGIQVNSSNNFYFFEKMKGYPQFLKEFGVKKIVKFNLKNELIIDDVP